MRHLAKSALLLGAAIVAEPCLAQAADPVPEGEIVVTAQKREQRLTDTPLAISAFGEDALKARGTNSISDLVSSAPGLSGAQVSGTQPLLTIRGIGTNDFSIGVDPALGIYVDEVYIGRSAGAITNIFDVDRVEVVKGPQGTLFGRNTTAGAISIVRNQPKDRFEAHADAEYGSFNLFSVSGVVNAPLTDTVAARASLYYRKRDGDNRRVLGGPAAERIDSFSGRAALRYKGANLTYDLNVDYQRDRNGGPAYQSFTFNGDRPALGYYDTATDLGDRDSKADRDVVLVSGRGTLDLGSLSLTSITAYRHYKVDYLEDTDGGPTTILNFGTKEKQDAWSQELRLNYTGEKVDAFLGASIFDEKLDSRSAAIYDEEAVCGGIARANGAGTLPCGILLNALSGGLVPVEFTGLPRVQEDVLATGKFSSWGVYGDVTFRPVKGLELILGARYSSDRKRVTIDVPAPVATLAPIVAGAPSLYVQSTSGVLAPPVARWDNFSPRFALRYAVTPDISAYANVAFGYKSGGFNILVPQKGKFDPEEVRSYEAGLKGDVLGGKLFFDVNGFYYTYTNLQVQIVEAVTYTNNAGSARGYGGEATLRAKPLPGLNLAGTLSLLDARYKRYTPTPGIDYRNNRLSRAPGISGSGSADYTFDIGHAGSVLLGSEVRFQSRQYFNPDNSAIQTGRAYAIVDARLTWTSANRRMSITGYVQNLNNARYETQTQVITPFDLAIFRAGDQRRFGVRASVEF
ncbi:MAG: TonB-dependent receptor [Sphingomonadales bacterium]|nr:TonB-dependent receptor [Sphingomonadales bacterium]